MIRLHEPEEIGVRFAMVEFNFIAGLDDVAGYVWTQFKLQNVRSSLRARIKTAFNEPVTRADTVVFDAMTWLDENCEAFHFGASSFSDEWGAIALGWVEIHHTDDAAIFMLQFGDDLKTHHKYRHLI